MKWTKTTSATSCGLVAIVVIVIVVIVVVVPLVGLSFHQIECRYLLTFGFAFIHNLMCASLVTALPRRHHWIDHDRPVEAHQTHKNESIDAHLAVSRLVPVQQNFSLLSTANEKRPNRCRRLHLTAATDHRVCVCVCVCVSVFACLSFYLNNCLLILCELFR